MKTSCIMATVIHYCNINDSKRDYARNQGRLVSGPLTDVHSRPSLSHHATPDKVTSRVGMTVFFKTLLGGYMCGSGGGSLEPPVKSSCETLASDTTLSSPNPDVLKK